MGKNNSKSKTSVSKRAKERFKSFKGKLEDALQLPKLTEDDQAMIRDLCGYGRPMEAILASNMRLRWTASRSVRTALLAHRGMGEVVRQNYVFGTLVDDVGITSDRVPVVRLSDIRDKAYRTLKSAGLNAFGVVEVHPLMNHPAGGDGRSLLFHVHFVGWPTDLQEEFQAGSLEKEINSSRAWRCELGAPPAKIQQVKPKKRDLSAISYYLFKPPHSAKNKMESNQDPSKWRLMDTVKGYRPELGLRVIEAYSQIDLRDTMFGVNEGAKIRQTVRSAVADQHRKLLRNGSPRPQSEDIWLFWLLLRQRFGSQNFLPYRFQGSSILPLATKLRPAVKRKRPGSNQRRLKNRRIKKRTRKLL